ncbi:MAG TPA: DUF4270 family protein, partial [Chitinophagaceae bacterium]|nr:DUF4270 family protein [Chitinophagaceae bacterium]
GSYATIKIPALKNISNRVVHRAELIMEQVYHPSAAVLLPPDLLYLDAFDSAKNRYRTIPFDVLVSPQTQQPYFQITNVAPFGMVAKKNVNTTGNTISTWKFNITRYIQNVLTKSEPLQDLRVYSPYIIHNYVDAFNTAGILFGNNSYAIGQVRLGGGNNATQPMRLHIIYSRL